MKTWRKLKLSMKKLRSPGISENAATTIFRVNEFVAYWCRDPPMRCEQEVPRLVL
jgi:hypothetical protein